MQVSRWAKVSLIIAVSAIASCQSPLARDFASYKEDMALPSVPSKPVVYQVFTRLFGNKVSRNEPWGTLEQNGVGKFADFTPKALNEIRRLGVTHIWYTGILHHALVTDYSAFGISPDDPDVVKGRAGSPYAVKDYYNVNPDLAVNPELRMEEFEALVTRTHNAGLKVIIDIVPNHVARHYKSLGKPDDVVDFGVNDDVSVTYARDNNFYYIVNEPFHVPLMTENNRPLGGEAHPLSDGMFEERPAKWTGNGSRLAQPHSDDWYETVKINYGVKPDGSYDFIRLPSEFKDKPYTEHAAFWAEKSVPDSWKKFRDITQFWLAKGVDGFRYDMAEMVPIEFWSYLNSTIKTINPEAFLLAEVYQPSLYRDYIALGKMDYLYDKVGLYDALKAVMQNNALSSVIDERLQEVSDISPHMLHFLENHDEQRIASPEFAGDAALGVPAMLITALTTPSPTLVYFGQEVGEKAEIEGGFGKPSRTSIFDYVGVPAHQRWMNDGAFDGGQLTVEEKQLRQAYQSILKWSGHPSMKGQYLSLHQESLKLNSQYSEQQFSFARVSKQGCLLAVANFAEDARNVKIALSKSLLSACDIPKLNIDKLSQHEWVRDEDGSTTYLKGTLTGFSGAILVWKEFL